MRFFKKEQGVTLACFSPPVILATFLIEIALAVYAWWRYRATPLGRRAVVFLSLLAVFQLSEYIICVGGTAGPFDLPVLWAKVGYVAIAFLPILAIDFIAILAKQRLQTVVGYAAALAFSAFIVFYPGLFGPLACTGKFVFFKTNLIGFELAYGLYYFAALFTGIGLIGQALRRQTPNRAALIWVLVGYVSFMLPTFAVYIIAPAMRDGFPSVLCGFAVLTAIIIVAKVLPLASRK